MLVGGELHKLAVDDVDADRVDLAGAFALGFVHQLVGACEQVVRELARDRPPLADRAEQQADDADVDVDRLVDQAGILGNPVVALRPPRGSARRSPTPR